MLDKENDEVVDTGLQHLTSFKGELDMNEMYFFPGPRYMLSTKNDTSVICYTAIKDLDCSLERRDIADDVQLFIIATDEDGNPLGYIDTSVVRLEDELFIHRWIETLERGQGYGSTLERVHADLLQQIANYTSFPIQEFKIDFNTSISDPEEAQRWRSLYGSEPRVYTPQNHSKNPDEQLFESMHVQLPREENDTNVPAIEDSGDPTIGQFGVILEKTIALKRKQENL